MTTTVGSATPEGATLRESHAMLDTLLEKAARKMEDTGVRLLWGTANLFSHPRFAAGKPRVALYPAAGVGGGVAAAVVENRALIGDIKLRVFINR